MSFAFWVRSFGIDALLWPVSTCLRVVAGGVLSLRVLRLFGYSENLVVLPLGVVFIGDLAFRWLGSIFPLGTPIPLLEFIPMGRRNGAHWGSRFPRPADFRVE